MHSRSLEIIEPRTRALPGRSTSGGGGGARSICSTRTELIKPHQIAQGHGLGYDHHGNRDGAEDFVPELC